jgi:hypothetical protein
MPRFSIPVALIAILMLAACSAATPTSAPATTTTEPTEQSNAISPSPAPIITPTPMPPLDLPLPTTNTFAGLKPEGAVSVLGLGWVSDYALSPDESMVAVDTSIGVIVLDTMTMAEVWAAAGRSDYAFLGWSNDGSRLAVAASSNIWIHDAKTGNVLNRLSLQDVYGDNPYTHFSKAAWSPDNTHLAVSGEEAVIWDLVSGQSISRLDQDSASSILDIFWLPDGTLIGSTFERETIVWNADTGEVLWKVEGEPVDWAPDLSILRTWNESSEETILWSLNDRAKIGVLDGRASISPDWTMVAVASAEGAQVRELSIEGPGNRIWSLKHPVPANYMIWSPDQSRLAVVSLQSYRIWDIDTGQSVCVIENASTESSNVLFLNIEWVTNNREIVSNLSRDNALIRWGLETCEPVGVIPLGGELYRDTFFTSANRVLLDTWHSLTLWDITDEREMGQITEHFSEGLRWASDSAHLITFDDDQTVEWDAISGEAIGALTILEADAIAEGLESSASAVSPDSSLDAQVGEDGIAIYQTGTEEVVITLEAPVFPGGPNGHVAWSPDGTRLAANLLSGLYIWDTGTWELLVHHTEMKYGYALAFSPDGRYLAANANGAVVVWEVP